MTLVLMRNDASDHSAYLSAWHGGPSFIAPPAGV